MVNKLFGEKIGMTRYFVEEGKSIPVTILKMGPCVVVQKKTLNKDGYNAIQVGYGEKKKSRVNKAQEGHFKIAGDRCFAHLKEIKTDDTEELDLGKELTSEIFNVGDLVNVSGLSKGRGFSGVMKRWGFSGGRKTHGSRSHRIPGSIGSSATPGRVHKGRKLPGRMGHQRVTVKNLEVVDVRTDMNLVLVKGAVPGSRNSFVELCKA
ncbi:MAG: 50S ribosomal protein L3 [Deltaproteobacteria bacterium]|nr:50S ribosomal protein L3 [Deltaproteobacteria bacterium]